MSAQVLALLHLDGDTLDVERVDVLEAPNHEAAIAAAERIRALVDPRAARRLGMIARAHELVGLCRRALRGKR